MSTTITSDNGIEIEVVELGLSVIDHEDQTETWVRLTPGQCRALADALDQGSAVVIGGRLTAPESQYKRERDAAVARAEQLRDERDDAVWSCMAVGRERDEWKASADKWHGAWQRSAPVPVSRADIEKAMADAAPRLAPYGACVDAVHALLSGDDPAVFVVRESDIEDCQRNEDGDWEFRHSGRVFHDSRDPADRAESLTHHREQIAQRVAIIRAIEAEQATDPVEVKARELCSEAFPDHDWGNAPWDTEDHWRPIEDGFRRLARHQLGKEARDGADR